MRATQRATRRGSVPTLQVGRIAVPMRRDAFNIYGKEHPAVSQAAVIHWVTAGGHRLAVQGASARQLGRPRYEALRGRPVLRRCRSQIGNVEVAISHLSAICRDAIYSIAVLIGKDVPKISLLITHFTPQ